MLKWQWYDDIKVKALFLHLLLKANFVEAKWRGMIILPGQLITSVEKLSVETGLSIKEVRTALKKLQDTEEIQVKTTNKSTLITVNKYEQYQEGNFESTSVEKTEKKAKQQKSVYPIDSFEMKASAYLRDKIQSLIPNANVPNTEQDLQKWAVHIDRMKRIDGLTEQTIRELIRFATTDNFWQSTILSTEKLRKKKDTLYAQMKKPQNQSKNSSGATFGGIPKGATGIMEWLEENKA